MSPNPPLSSVLRQLAYRAELTTPDTALVQTLAQEVRRTDSRTLNRWITQESEGWAGETTVPAYRIYTERIHGTPVIVRAPLGELLDVAGQLANGAGVYDSPAAAEARFAQAHPEYGEHAADVLTWVLESMLPVITKLALVFSLDNGLSDQQREQAVTHLIYDRIDPRGFTLDTERRTPTRCAADAASMRLLLTRSPVRHDETNPRMDQLVSQSLLLVQARPTVLATNFEVEHLLFRVLQECVNRPEDQHYTRLRRRCLVRFPEMRPFFDRGLNPRPKTNPFQFQGV